MLFKSCLIRKINDEQAITTDRQGKTFCHNNCKDMVLTGYYQESIPCLFVFSFSCVFFVASERQFYIIHWCNVTSPITIFKPKCANLIPKVGLSNWWTWFLHGLKKYAHIQSYTNVTFLNQFWLFPNFRRFSPSMNSFVSVHASSIRNSTIEI